VRGLKTTIMHANRQHINLRATFKVSRAHKKLPITTFVDLPNFFNFNHPELMVKNTYVESPYCVCFGAQFKISMTACFLNNWHQRSLRLKQYVYASNEVRSLSGASNH
jgi:hypothetical protein